MSNILSQRLSQFYNSEKLPWLIIGVGIALRLTRYIHNPSLWFDEADIAIDIINTPISELFYPSLDYNRAYPFLFMLSIKLLTMFFGNSEYVVRLFPLLAGVGSLFLFFRVAKYFLVRDAMIIALGLFAIMDSLVFQSSNLKPYSSDVFFTLLIISLMTYVQSKKSDSFYIVLLGMCGAIAVWYSTPILFVLVVVGACLLVSSLIENKWQQTTKLIIICSLWLFSFAANYFLYLRPLQASFGLDMKVMLAREKALMPIPPASLADIKWFMELFFDVFNKPLSITLTGLAAAAFLVGLISMYSRQRNMFLVITSPLLLTFLAGAAHQYPFRDRFIFFLLPFILLIVAEGAEYIRARTMQTGKVIGITFLMLLFLHPLATSAYRLKKPFYWEDIKPVMHYVKDNWQQGDIIYLHYFAQYSFEYYAKYYPEPRSFREDEYIVGIAPRKWYGHWRKQEVSRYYPVEPFTQTFSDIFKAYREDLIKLKGNKRVWIIFVESITTDSINEEKYFIYNLETMGAQLDRFGQSGVSVVYLYDLSVQPEPISEGKVKYGAD